MICGEDVKGFNELEVNQDMFKAFLNNFMKAWGLEARETIVPLQVKFIKDTEGKYLRFDYEIYGKKEWLHVTSSSTWY